MEKTTPLSGAGQDRLISHGPGEEASFEAVLESARSRLRAAPALPGVTLDQQLALLDELAGFELGRFLLVNRGLNAWWTHQLVTYDPSAARADSLTDLERRVFEALPATLATRQRFGIFRAQLQKRLAPGMALASVPCGLMGELLLLDYTGLEDVTLTGIDLDQQALDAARQLAETRGLGERVTLRREDAWALSLENAVDVLTSNGLNIYEPDDARVVALYRSFFQALKPGGTLVTSFLTPAPAMSPDSPWDMTKTQPALLQLQYLLFVRLIDAKWSAYRTHAQTAQQLEEAGFTNVEFIDDDARMFPTVIARKPA
jgi:SAM-dependent methyltransferase